MHQSEVLILKSDARRIPLRDETVQCCVTSPPYYGLRDYGVAGQIGLEQTPDEYIAELVRVFREVWRVLRPDGTLWVNIGDSYVGSGGAHKELHQNPGKSNSFNRDGASHCRYLPQTYLKPKDLIGIPWMLAFALRDVGWYLRRDIIWHKPNFMPESAKDRPMGSHEYIFLFSKSRRYFYDLDAVRIPHNPSTIRRTDNKVNPFGGNNHENRAIPVKSGSTRKEIELNPNGRNLDSVWKVATAAYADAHFAVFPPALIEPCIKSGSRAGDYVLDPFGGSGTTARVALRLGRSAVHADLGYHDLARSTRLAEIQRELCF